jgi:hypothetical protein
MKHDQIRDAATLLLRGHGEKVGRSGWSLALPMPAIGKKPHHQGASGGAWHNADGVGVAAQHHHCASPLLQISEFT